MSGRDIRKFERVLLTFLHIIAQVECGLFCADVLFARRKKDRETAVLRKPQIDFFWDRQSLLGRQQT